MMRVTGRIPNRVPSRQPSATAPLSFEFVADVEIEPAQPTPEAQQQRDARWLGFIDRLTQEAACA